MKKIKKQQEIKFVIIGGFNTILDFTIFIILTNFFGVSEILANIFSTGVTFIISFILNKKITFESKNLKKQEIIKEMLLFTVVTLFGLWVIQSGIINILKPLFESITKNKIISTLASKVIATLFSLTWNFILYKKVVFKNSK